jgi:hypothetical protein
MRNSVEKGNDMMESIAVANVTCAIVSAKWALELGVNQVRQILFLLAGLLFGPLTLLVLYVYFIENAKKRGWPGGRLA